MAPSLHLLWRGPKQNFLILQTVRNLNQSGPAHQTLVLQLITLWLIWPISLDRHSTDNNNSSLDYKMTSAKVFKTSVTTTNKSPYKDYSHLDNKTT